MAEAPASGRPGRPAGRELRVLLVEDDASIRRFVALALEEEALQLDTACSLAEARAALARADFDLVIADLMLGDGNGLDLLRELASRPTVTRIAFSAGIDRTTRARLDALGVTEVLAKPVSLAALHEAVTQARQALRPEGAPGTRAGQAAQAPAIPPSPAETAAIEGYFGGERSLYLLYRQQCLAQFADDLRQGDTCAAADDAAAMRRLAHSLKSVLAMLGADAAAACARAMEDSAAAGDTPRAAALWRELSLALQALREAGSDAA